MTIEVARPGDIVSGVTAPTAAALRLRRLDRLRGGPAPIPDDDPADASPPAPVPLEPAQRGRPAPDARTLAFALGGDVVTTAGGPVVVVESQVSLPARLDALAGLPVPMDPGRPFICVDTETTGLGTAAGTVPFLVGVGWWEADRFRVRQLLMPDHPSERPLLAVLAAALPESATLVSYNGRAFDWPLLVSRFRMHGQPPPRHAAHLDLLTIARQVWKHRLEDARLASVEQGVVGVTRADDLPGAAIPDRWFSWLRSGRPDLLVDVVRHNRQDIVSLALLLRVLAEELLPARDRWGAGAGPGPMGEDAIVQPGDLAGLGGSFARHRRHEEALDCYEAALERLAPWHSRELQDRIAVDRARVLARLGRKEEAAGAWEAVALDGGPLAALAWIAVAKAREHLFRDPRRALDAAQRAEALAARSRLFGMPDRVVERDVGKRIARLRRTLAASGEQRAVRLAEA